MILKWVGYQPISIAALTYQDIGRQQYSNAQELSWIQKATLSYKSSQSKSNNKRNNQRHY